MAILPGGDAAIPARFARRADLAASAGGVRYSAAEARVEPGRANGERRGGGE